MSSVVFIWPPLVPFDREPPPVGEASIEGANVIPPPHGRGATRGVGNGSYPSPLPAVAVRPFPTGRGRGRPGMGNDSFQAPFFSGGAIEEGSGVRMDRH